MRSFIFDMDGLLVDSEPLWREAEIAIFESVGLSLTEELCRETIGLRVDEAVRHWHARFPWRGPSCDEVTRRLLDAAEALILERGSLMAGAEDVIGDLHARRAKLAIASSSPLRLIEAVVDKFAIASYFTVLHSAEQEAAGKPDPAVYRTVMSLLGAEPKECVAFEDSLSGVRAAKAAGAKVVAVPAPEDAQNRDFAIADLVLGTLEDFSVELLPL